MFPEILIETTQVVQKIWRLSLSILLFSDFLDFLTFPCYKETNDVSVQQIMSPFCHFQHTLNRLFNICMELYWYYVSSSWNINETVGEGGRTLQKKLPSERPALLGLKLKSFWKLLSLSISQQTVFSYLKCFNVNLKIQWTRPQMFFCGNGVLQLLCHNVEGAHDIKCSQK